MRLWLKDSERLPDPPPMKTDDRAAFLVGTILWVVAAVLAAVFTRPLAAEGEGWVLAMTLVGVGTGLLGFVYTQVRRTRSGRTRPARTRPARTRPARTGPDRASRR